MFTKTITNESKHQTVMGPRGLKLVLDASEIFPDRPGDGTPRLVYFKRETMTLDCALSNIGEILVGCRTSEDAQWAYDWLDGLSQAADDWLDYQYKLLDKSPVV
jgi:hypothetical protein